MAALSFFVKGKTQYKIIHYTLSHKSKQYRASLGLRIHENDWDNKSNFLKPSARSAAHIELRKKLIEMQNYVYVDALIEDANISFEQLKDKFITFAELDGRNRSGDPSNPIEAIDAYKERLREQKSPMSTLNQFTRLSDLLHIFYDREKLSLNMKAYTEAQKQTMVDKLVSFLLYEEIRDRFGEVTKAKYSNVTAKKYLTQLKTACDYYGVALDIKTKKIFPSKKFSTDNSSAVYFTTEEIMFLYQYKPKHDYLKEVLDLLVFGAFTGLRHGELKYVTRSSVKTDTGVDGEVFRYLERYSPKERNTNYVPLNRICCEIIDKYMDRDSDVLLPVKSNQYCNQEIHKMLETAHEMFGEEVTIIKHYGTEMVSTKSPRWKELTFHSARHHYSFYLRKIGLGLDDAAVMLNHKTTETTRKHYKHDDAIGIMKITHNKMKAGDLLLTAV